MEHLTKINGWWRGPEKEWQKEIYGFYPRGLGDLIAINCQKIMDDGKGLNILLECGILLSKRERWPLELEDGIQQYIAKNRIQWRWSQLLRRLKIRKTELYRSRNSITLDPYIYYMATFVKLGKYYNGQHKPPWYLTWRRSEFRHWRRALLGKRNCYRFWRWVTPSRKDFVKKLDQLMWDAYVMRSGDNGWR